MAVVTLKDYVLGDMTAHYVLDEEKKLAELMLLPAGMECPAWEAKNQTVDSLIQLKLAGDMYPNAYAGGVTMRQSDSVLRMQYQEQTAQTADGETVIRTVCRDDRGYEAAHYLVWREGEKTVESYVTFTNHTHADVSLEMISSFSLGGITPYTPGDAHEDLYLHRVRGVWSMEGRAECTPFEDLQLEPSWAVGYAVRCERFGGIGSLPVNTFFPHMVVEDRRNHIYWGAQLAHNASWQMEVYRRDDSAAMSGGLADRDFGHWMKTVKPGTTFTTPSAALTVAAGGDADRAAQRLTSSQCRAAEAGPECEQELPIIFNEYCTTWGCPSHENIRGILEAIKGRGFSYFVIDCGWYKADGIPWDVSMGDYSPSATLFPEGLEKTTAAIREAGMTPGIWFEIDNVGPASDAYKLEEHLLKRDGRTLTTAARRFWDMRQPWVVDYLSDRVIETLKKYGFGYMKMDYNDTIGIGCDGAESLGEGLRQNMEASYAFIEKVKEEIPGIVLENCASGGHKLEPKMMGVTSMASFSDAHECEEIPLVAAGLHRVILPRQSQIWAVIRESDSLKRIAYSMANTFLGRMCLSGDVTNLSDAQWNVIDRGIAFYREIAPVIRDGVTSFFGERNKSWRHAQGWQGILREGERDAYALFHIFGGPLPQEMSVTWPAEREYEILSVYSDDEPEISLKENVLYCRGQENWKAVAVHLRRK